MGDTPTTTGVYNKLADVDTKAGTNLLPSKAPELDKELLASLSTSRDDLKKRYEDNKPLLTDHQTILDKVRFVSDTQARLNRSMLEELDEVERQISIKDRLTMINRDSAKKKEDQIKVILGSSSLFMIGIIALVGYLSGVLTLTQFGGFLIVICLLAVLMVFFLKVNVTKEFRKLEKDIGQLQKEIIREGDKLSQSTMEWVDQNCECDQDNSSSQDQKLPKDRSDTSSPDQKSDKIYYQDGSGPTVSLQDLA